MTPIPPALLEAMDKIGCVIEPCGSQITVDPPPGDASDSDYLVCITGTRDNNKSIKHGIQSVADMVNLLSENEFRWKGGEHYQIMISTDFMSFRKDDLNLIVTNSPDFFDKHQLATHVCKRLNLERKADRITVFQAILYFNKWDGNPARVKAAKSEFDAATQGFGNAQHEADDHFTDNSPF